MSTKQATDSKVEVEKAVIVKDTKNDVTRPGAETSTGRVWAICDLIYSEATPDNPITRSRVIKTAEAEDINVSTAATQYGRWRKYMGLEREAPKAVKEKTETKSKTKKVDTAVKAEAGAAVVEAAPTALDAALGDGEEAQA